MTRVPVLPTILVALAVAAMIALGLWQLDRRDEKEAAIRQLAANITRPVIRFPNSPVGDALLFRRAEATCARTAGWSRSSGRNAAGASGWRQIVECVDRTGGIPFKVQLGISRNPDAGVSFTGGTLRGYISHAPDQRPLLAGVFDRTPTPLMLVVETPPAGLEPNAPPDLSAVPNNHLAYAVQWFLFAAIAAVIYALALRRRGGGRTPS